MTQRYAVTICVLLIFLFFPFTISKSSAEMKGSTEAEEPARAAEGAGVKGSAQEIKESAYYVKKRQEMIEYLKAAGVTNAAVLDAMGRVMRQKFMPVPKKAYDERAFKLGPWAVAASPYVTALKLNALGLKPGEKVFEVGTETGYQAVVMSLIGAEVYSVEYVPEIGVAARERLEELGYKDVHLRIGDGYDGWKEAAPFDAMVFAPAPDEFPPKLVEQLKEGGRMVLSLGKLYGPQTLVYAWKEGGKMKVRPLADIKSPPMRGKIME